MEKWTTNDGGKSYELHSSDNRKGACIFLHHYVGCGDIWFVSCHDFRIAQVELGEMPVEKAKMLAYNIVKTKAKHMYEDILSMGEHFTLGEIKHRVEMGEYNIREKDGSLIYHRILGENLQQLRADICDRLAELFSLNETDAMKMFDRAAYQYSLADDVNTVIDGIISFVKAEATKRGMTIDSSEFKG